MRRKRGIPFISSPLLAGQVPIWRSRAVSLLMLLAFVILAIRAFYVQVWNNDFFIKQGAVRFVRTIELPADRGEILDTNGTVLAFSRPSPSFWADPEDVDASLAQLAKLANLLGLSEKDLQAKIANKHKQFVWLKRQIPEDAGKQIMAMRLSGIYQRMEYARSYPEGESMAQIVGFTNIENQGQDGIELAFNKQLAGKPGYRRVIKDRMGRPIENIGDVLAPTPGNTVQLSIDSRIQYFAYNNVRKMVTDSQAKDGSIVVLDAKTGGILAMANYPSFTPEDRADFHGDNVRNRALTDLFEPGSTMKPLVVSLGLQKGVITPDTMIETAPGYINMGGFRITDTHDYGLLSVAQVIQKSSNIGALKISTRLSAKDMWDMYRLVGFGQKPNLPFPGVASGRLRAYQTWRPVEQATMAYGYGLSVSLMQLAHAYMLFARDGQIVPLSILKTPSKVGGIQVIDPKHIADVNKMLGMVTEAGGTGTLARTIGYSVGGKTGTSHVQQGKGYSRSRYHGVFVGLAPLSNPRIVIAVMINQPTKGSYYGGMTAAPVFGQTAQEALRVMGVQPDIPVTPDVIEVPHENKKKMEGGKPKP